MSVMLHFFGCSVISCMVDQHQAVLLMYAGSTILPKTGAVVEYAFTITNSATAVSPVDQKLEVVLANITADTSPALQCLRSDTSAVPLGTSDTGSDLLSADEVVTCTFSVTVTSAEVTSGELPAFTIQAQLVNATDDTATDFGTFLSVAAVPVYSGSTLQQLSGTPSVANGVDGKQ